MLVVHHLGISQSDRIVWLCEELGIHYELKRYARDPVSRLAPAEYRALHPFGTAPVIHDGNLVLGESGAIVEYLINKHGNGRLAMAPDRSEYADYLFWFHFANGSMMPSGMMDLIAGMLGPSPPSVLTTLRERGNRAHALVDARLAQSEYLAGGEFTAADIMMMFPLSTMRLFAPRDLTPYPHIQQYLQRLAARPGYQRAMAKADPGFTAPVR